MRTETHHDAFGDPRKAPEAASRVHDLLSAAAELARGFDFSGALSRARDAGAIEPRLPADGTSVPGGDVSGEVEVERGRFEARERAWRNQVERRSAAYTARERAEADGPLLTPDPFPRG